MSSASFDFELRLALGLAVASIVVSVGLVLQVLAMRLAGERQARRRAALQDAWRPLLLRAATGEHELIDALPPHGRDAVVVLVLWIKLQDSLRGSAHAALNELALRLGFAALARRWVAKGSLVQRVTGLMTLGHLGRPDDRSRLRLALDDPRTPASMAAASALLRIDPAGAMALVLDQFLQRNDWPAARVGTLLRDAGAEAVAPALIERLLAAAPPEQVRLLPLLRFAETPHAGGVIETLVQRSDDPQVLSLALRQLHSPAALARVRALIQHPDALVRSAAAVALGRIGEAIDRVRLIQALADRDWWVRYRAGEALVSMPGLEPRVLKVLQAGLEDRFARDMLRHAWAERQLRLGLPPTDPFAPPAPSTP